MRLQYRKSFGRRHVAPRALSSVFLSHAENRLPHLRRMRTPSQARDQNAKYRGPESFVDAAMLFDDMTRQESCMAGAKADLLDQIHRLLSVLPPTIRSKLESQKEIEDLIEIVMDLGRPPLARFPSGDVVLSASSVSREDLASAVLACGEFGGDNRAGIDGTLHRISAIRNRNGDIVGLTCRVGRAQRGAAAMIVDQATAGRSILFLGRPGVGKTTVIRELSRYLADELLKRVVIVDTSNEIGGDGDVPHAGIGRARRMQVPNPSQQHRVMIEAVENHTPEVVIIDEIGTEAEALAARTIAQRGVQLIATAHGNELENIMKNPSLNDLVGGIASVTLGDDEAKRRGVRKSILERESPPTFDVAVEMDSRNSWRIHLDVSSAVDSLLLGREAGAEARERDAHGRIWAWPEDASTSEDDVELDSDNDSRNVHEAGREGRRNERERRIETQPFPEAALVVARGQEGRYGGRSLNSGGDLYETYLGQRRDHSNVGTADAMKGAWKSGKTRSSKLARASVAEKAQNKKVLYLFLYGVDDDTLMCAAEALRMDEGQIETVGMIQGAHAVLATRPRLKSSGWIRAAAQSAQIPVFSVRSPSIEHVIKGLRTLIGVDPSPGGAILPSLFDTEYKAASADPRNRPRRQDINFETNMELLKVSLRKDSSQRITGEADISAATREGIFEAQTAIESVVLPTGRPVDLMPRAEDVIQHQISTADEYNVMYEVLKAGTDYRVRLLPCGYVSTGDDEESSKRQKEILMDASRMKKYW